MWQEDEWAGRRRVGVGAPAGPVRLSKPTMYFLGVTTANSSGRKMFPHWAAILGLGNAQLVGIDLPINGPAHSYRDAVRQIKDDPLALGALVTTHKLSSLKAARDLFDQLTDEALLCEELSCIYKREERLIGHAVDPYTSGAAMKRFLSPGYWQTHPADLLCLGAGGAAVALLTGFMTRAGPQDRPKRIIFVDHDQHKLDNMRRLLARLPDTDTEVDLVHNSDPAANDHLVALLPSHSMVINATGMGKDIPGSPLTHEARFPEHGVVWELNYRGDLDFLQQARQQASSRNLLVEDGWFYFLLGWSEVVSHVFDLEIDDSKFKLLSLAAESVRDRP